MTRPRVYCWQGSNGLGDRGYMFIGDGDLGWVWVRLKEDGSIRGERKWLRKWTFEDALLDVGRRTDTLGYRQDKGESFLELRDPRSIAAMIAASKETRAKNVLPQRWADLADAAALEFARTENSQ